MIDKMNNGIIIKLTGGFYYVETAEKVYECKARGKFRHKDKSPCVGDYVELEFQKEGYTLISKIINRKNRLVRPAVANIDKLFIIVSTCKPLPNTLIIDKIIASAINKNIEPIIIISKIDLAPYQEIEKIYVNAGFKTIVYSGEDENSLNKIKDLLKDGISVFTGNSGVGKSTLLNYIFPNLDLATSHTSEKLGRGRHTTRTVELFKTYGGYVADTPGFSNMELERYEIIKKEDIQHCFPEFEKYLGLCKFNSCAHVKEKGCKILEALEKGEIEKSRFDSYVAMYNEVKDIKEWQLK